MQNDNLEKSDRLDFIINDNLNECLHIGDKAPLFNAKTTFGNIKLSDYAGKWLILFSHPRWFYAYTKKDILKSKEQ